mmetsp:Transcript_72784/g.235320  ORF Transcript_72784/g.235320 Transcript_72784/m.235320 type:complete len:255 (+) Transcript_72784:3-767(+)
MGCQQRLRFASCCPAALRPEFRRDVVADSRGDGRQEAAARLGSWATVHRIRHLDTVLQGVGDRCQLSRRGQQPRALRHGLAALRHAGRLPPRRHGGRPRHLAHAHVGGGAGAGAGPAAGVELPIRPRGRHERKRAAARQRLLDLGRRGCPARPLGGRRPDGGRAAPGRGGLRPGGVADLDGYEHDSELQGADGLGRRTARSGRMDGLHSPGALYRPPLQALRRGARPGRSGGPVAGQLLGRLAAPRRGGGRGYF